MRLARVLIATFSLRVGGKRTAVNGMIEPLLSFFLPRAERIDLIDGPHPGSDTTVTIIEEYQAGKLINSRKSAVARFLSPLLTFTNTNATQLSFKLRDFLSVIEVAIRQKNKTYDLFIGLESVYALAGILLKKLGKIKTVVYYVSDYSPLRFSNPLVNALYIILDRLCCYGADYIWDVSPAMHPARLRAGLNPGRSAPVILVPNALTPEQISYTAPGRLKPYSLVYAGTLGPENGPDLAIEAIPVILKRFPKTILHIIGGDEFESALKESAKKLGLKRQVVFHGFIPEARKVSNLTKSFMIGLAPYRALPLSPRWFADATKIRLYLGAGLPVVTTHVPPLGKEVERAGASLVIKDDPKAIASAVIKLFSNPKKYQAMRQAAIAFARHNTWQRSYSRALEKMKAGPRISGTS